MADAYTANFNLIKPEEGFSVDTWGAKLNLNFDAIDTLLRQVCPPGTVLPFAGANAPAGFLLCDGSAVSRTEYAELFAVIGTTWGAGNGSTTFNLPDLRGVFLRGVDGGRGFDPGRVLGSLQQDDLKSHTHTGTTSQAGSHTHSASTGSAGSHSHSAGSFAVQVPSNVVPRDGWGTSGGNIGSVASGRLVVGSGNWESAETLESLRAAGGNMSLPLQSRNISGSSASAGDHTHSVTVGSAGNHTHTFTTEAAGGSETRPKNAAVNFIIRY